MADINSTSTRMVTKKQLIDIIEKNFEDTEIMRDYVAIITTASVGDVDSPKFIQSVTFEKVLEF